MATLTRMIHNNSDEPVVMLHFDNMDVAMVYVYEVCENNQLKRAVTQVRDKLQAILANSSTDDLLEISYKIDKIISTLVQ